MQNLRRAFVSGWICVMVFLCGCQEQNARKPQETTESGVIVRPGALRITSTMIELRVPDPRCTTRGDGIGGS